MSANRTTLAAVTAAFLTSTTILAVAQTGGAGGGGAGGAAGGTGGAATGTSGVGTGRIDPQQRLLSCTPRLASPRRRARIPVFSRVLTILLAKAMEV